MKVTEVMSRPVITVRPEQTVKEAAQLLIEHSISAMPVIDGSGRLVGIVSEADLMPMQARPDPRSQATPVKAGHTPGTVAEVMTPKVIIVRSSSEVSEAVRTMLDAGIKRVPVVSGRRVVGIVSRRDLVRLIARTDDLIVEEVSARLQELGIATAGHVRVSSGVVTIELDDSGPGRRLAESVALSVPGVLEVRFAPIEGPKP